MRFETVDLNAIGSSMLDMECGKLFQSLTVWGKKENLKIMFLWFDE